MARKRTTAFAKFVTLLTFAVAAFCIIYFFFPDLSESLFDISWKSSNYTMSVQERESLVTEIVTNIKNSYQDSGASEEEIEKVLSQLDRETLTNAAEKALKSGRDGVSTFVDTLDESIDFGQLDTDVVKQQLESIVSEIDFSEAMGLMREYLKGGFESLEVVLEDLVNQ